MSTIFDPHEAGASQRYTPDVLPAPTEIDIKAAREMSQRAGFFGELPPDYEKEAWEFVAHAIALGRQMAGGEELEAYRNGGVTEEILRRNDGFIKVGEGCAIVRAEEFAQMRAKMHAVETLMLSTPDSGEPAKT